jgi:hypothetical protein
VSHAEPQLQTLPSTLGQSRRVVEPPCPAATKRPTREKYSDVDQDLCSGLSMARSAAPEQPESGRNLPANHASGGSQVRLREEGSSPSPATEQPRTSAAPLLHNDRVVPETRRDCRPCRSVSWIQQAAPVRGLGALGRGARSVA